MTTWTLLGSYSGETSWGSVETKTFSANATAGPYSFFKLVGKRVNHSTAAFMAIGEILLIGVYQEVQVPPSDIGSALSWSKDGSVTYGGFHTFTKDYASGACPGTYRVRTNTSWYDMTGASGALGGNEWPPSGAFDNQPGAGSTRTAWAIGNSLSCGLNKDCNAELILETPCSIEATTWWVQAEDAHATASTPSAITLSGSADEGATWTELGSFSGETGFTQAEVRNYTANGGSAGAFNWFKFFIKRTGQSTPTHATMSGVGLYGNPALQILPPSDIGAGASWTKDPSFLYSGVYTLYKDHAGPVCPGRFRAMTNQGHWNDAGWFSFASNEFPVSGAFDRLASTASPGWNSATNLAGTSNANDATVELILKLPCSLVLESFTVQSRTDGFTHQAPSKASVYGSTDGASWTFVSSYVNETSWTAGEKKRFSADNQVGPFNYFKFGLQRISQAADELMHVGDIELYAWNVTDLCGSHNCDANAACENAGSSFSCECNYGFFGNGVSCNASVLIPPADIGGGSLWVDDSSETYNSLPTQYRQYAGSVCPGTYRAKANTDWIFRGASNEWGPAGAFDRQTASHGDQTGYSTNGNVVNSGTGDANDANVELILELPCRIILNA
uniref:EGF-like domain-containing protein n=1 Tax=Chromera velia CCMP2878 TaxID=1169474 RepID=A0A0G4FWQ2_9ALVE|eukprot:Cvel_19038.t1-p1 / transcript=Cvel_19038.t1 / gene=Cvel_19038 / organism=Chromera_velia_CCMP2878 / gene_product=hypothetical protein / transcript_product=hypothetical protein / location=Cvel_scaffold1613:15839-19870(+) / protein_length=617 / sequence_SO=supercontig / SO=protein_coding / is_pseudo=false